MSNHALHARSLFDLRPQAAPAPPVPQLGVVQATGISPVKTLLLLILLVTAQVFADDSAAPDFSKYPQSEGFTHFIQAHRTGDFFERRIIDSRQKPDSDPSAFEPLLFAMSRFWSSTGNNAIEYFVTASGYVTNCREYYHHATQAWHENQLTPDQLSNLKDAIKKLPKKNIYPPLDQLIIVSFREGDTWVTRTCHSDDVQAIYAVIGERYETAPKTKRAREQTPQ